MEADSWDLKNNSSGPTGWRGPRQRDEIQANGQTNRSGLKWQWKLVIGMLELSQVGEENVVVVVKIPLLTSEGFRLHIPAVGDASKQEVGEH